MLNTISFNGLKQSICLFICTICLSTSLRAQFEVGVWGGGNNYQGDLADAVVVLRETKLAYGGMMRYNINRFFTVRAHYLRGILEGNDLNSSEPDIRRRGFSFKSNLNELGFIGEFNFLGQASNSYDFKFTFNPYVFTGVGIVGTTGSPSAPNDVIPSPFPEKNSRNTFIAVPIGIGIKIQPLEQLSIGIEWGGRTAFSDYLDGVSQSGNPKKKDWYMFGGLTLTYCLNYESF
jgi:OmpA-OmpF porin, OOP family